MWPGWSSQISRRLCLWLEFWADLGRQHFMLSTNKEMGTQKSLYGKWSEDWWAWRVGCSGRRISNGSLGLGPGGRWMLFSDYQFFLEQNLTWNCRDSSSIAFLQRHLLFWTSNTCKLSRQTMFLLKKTNKHKQKTRSVKAPKYCNVWVT